MPKTRSLLQQEGPTLSAPDGRFWSTAGANPAELSSMYMIGLIDLQTLRSVKLPGSLALDPRGKFRASSQADGAWFQFPTPPKQYEIGENAATVITPTQGGGKFIESHGNIFKDIQIAGTVGLRPNPISTGNLLPAGVTEATGITISRPASLDILASAGAGNSLLSGKDERGLDPREATGFDDIIFLRNIFRLYFDLKRNNEYARRVAMVWRYVKESEVYVVEPLNFTTSRDSGNPLGYNYSITLRTLYKFDTTIKKPRDSLSVFESLSAGIAFTKQAIRDVAVALEQIGTAVDFARTLPFRIADSLVSEALGVMSSLASLATLGERMGSTTQKFLDRMSDHAKEFSRLASQVESGRAAGDRRVFSSRTFRPVGFIDIPLIAVEASLPILRNPAIRAGRKLDRVANGVRTRDALFQLPRQIQVSNFSRAYDVDAQAPVSSGTPLDPNNVVIPSSAREEEIYEGESIRDVAKRLMGDVAYWKTLALLNKAKPPYISTQSGDGVLVPGVDKILVPQLANAGDITGVAEDSTDTEASESLSPLIRKYGRDLHLVDNGATGADLAVGQNGDLALVEGIPNVSQAVVIKFSTEQGELALHPEYGAAFPIGCKVKLTQLQEFSLNTRATMLSDNRVEDVLQQRLFVEGDVLRVSAKAKLKQTNATLPVDFVVRRG